VSLHEGSSANGVRIVNFATKKNLVVKSTIQGQSKKKPNLFNLNLLLYLQLNQTRLLQSTPHCC